jgi:PAS domain S-box-containing protein
MGAEVLVSGSGSSAQNMLPPSSEAAPAGAAPISRDRDELLVVVVDGDGAVREMNRACQDATGWQLDALRGRPIWERLFSPPHAAEARRVVADPSGVAGSRRGEWVRSDGGQFDVTWSIAPLPGHPIRAVVVALDVTAAAAADLERREHEATLRALSQSTTAAIFIHRDAQLFYVNPAAQALTGYDRTALLSMDFWNLVHPSMREVARAQSAARLRGEAVPVRNEVKITTRSGETRWVEFAAAVIQHRGAAAVVGTAFDVTERRHSQSAQRDRERRFRALIEHSSDVVSVVGADARLTYVGPSVTRVLGHAPQDLEGRSILDIVHDDDRAAIRQGMREAMAKPGHPITVHYRLRHADGSWRWMEGVGTNLLHEPMIAGIIANVRDVTDRRRAEDLLRESQQRFALAVDGAKDGIWDWNVQTDEFYASPRMREILEIGNTRARTVDLFGERVHPEDLEHLRSGWRRHQRGTDTHYEVEYRLRAADGTYRWLLARGATVRNLEGTPYRMVGSLTDITARKRAEEDARLRQAELAHVLRVSAMSDMAAGLAHELNQPLAAIVNYARGCSRRLAETGAAPDLLEALDRIATEALRAGEVVRGLKRVIRKEPPRDSQIDLNEVARDAVALVRAEAAEREIALRLELEADLPRLNADRIQIEQVILNLLRNAADAISQRPGRVCLRTELSNGRAVVSISDTGDGIPIELRERVFAPFFTTKTSGLGMGLSISRTIIEAHGGRLWADANADSGTTFSFTLTLDGPPAAEDSPAGG